MFFRKPQRFLQSQPAATAVAEPDIELVTAAPINLRTEDIDTEVAHTKLAKKLGVFAQPQVAWRKLASVLAEEMIQVYDFEKVQTYMNKKAGGLHRVWQWFPLRKVDEPAPATHPAYISNGGQGGLGGLNPDLIRWEQMQAASQLWNGSVSGSFAQSRYTEAVPLPVLMTVDRLVDRLGEDAEFFVAAIGGPIDPFLAVRLKSDPQRTMFVIERWDQPDFRG